MLFSTRKVRLAVFAVLITIGVLLTVSMLHYDDDFGAQNSPEFVDPKNEILVTGDASKASLADEIKVEGPETPSINDVAAAVNAPNKEAASNSGKGTSNSPHKDLTEKPGELFSPEKEFNEILSFAPVVIFSKTYCPYLQRLKALLKNDYELIPEPIIVELDKHKHGKELQEYIGELSGRKTVPNLFVKGVSRGGSDDIKALHDAGTLLDLLTTWGGKNLKVSKHSVPSNS